MSIWGANYAERGLCAENAPSRPRIAILCKSCDEVQQVHEIMTNIHHQNEILMCIRIQKAAISET